MKRVLVTAICALSGALTIGSPASASCIDYEQYEIVHTDLNGDGRKEVVVYYPPIVSDVDPVDCLSTEPDPREVTGIDVHAVLALLEVGSS